MRTKARPLSELSVDPANARTHDERNLESIVGSLKRFGQQKPIVVDSSGVVRAGNGTLEAARVLGWKTIKTVQTDLQGSEATAYAIADNRTAELAAWDDDILAATLNGLVSEDAELLEVAGYTEAELDSMLADLGGNEVVEDEVPEPPDDPITQVGDLWLLGEHRVLCGDSTKVEDVKRLMGGEAGNAILTDPPYGIDAANMTMGSGKKDFAERGDWDKKRVSVKPLIGMSEQVIIWGGNYFSDELPVTNNWLCWHKRNDGLSFSEFELAWTTVDKNCRHLSHHWSGEEKNHPTQKPVKVMAWCIEMLEGVILDPFLGSGTTLIAAEQLNRKCYGLEISPAYCDVIVQRWETLTGGKATR